MKNILLIILFTGISGIAVSQNETTAGKTYEMKTYYLVLLKTGPNRTQDSLTAVKIQEGHMAHLNKMADNGKMCMAGPFIDDWEVRGICVYTTETEEEARKLANEDPAVKAGRLAVEIHPWYAAKGSTLP
jgi:uncharacterized protein YciI